MKKGYSIIEILIVIAIMGILAGGILTAYRFIAKENVTRHLVAKHEQDVAVLINQLLKDVESAGFGIDIDTLTSEDQEKKITIGDTLKFPSLASREEIWSGCWAVLNNGSLTIKSKNFMGQDCNFPLAWYIVLDPLNKKIITKSGQCVDSLCSDLTDMSGLVFYATIDDDYTYPQSFIVTYSLTQDNLPKECAPGTYNLAKTLGTQGKPGYQANQPVISCVFPNGFKVRAGIQSGSSISYQDSVSSDNIEKHNLKLFRICLILQVGGRQDTSSAQPQFSTDCGGGPTIDTAWWNNTGRWYRWKVIEQDIPLRNYQ